MLSYRHAFHAGNHADVFKHSVLLFVLDYLCQKDKPLCYIDTHAGAGVYSLRDAYAQKNTEYKEGVEKIMGSAPVSTILQDYQTLIKRIQKQHDFFTYPGSPMVAAERLRTDDRLQLCEMHTNEFENLKNWARHDKRILYKHINGFEALASFLPPGEKRGLVLIDPPYEVAQDYRAVLNALDTAVQRFSSGTVILWYPLLNKPEVTQLQKKLNRWDKAPCLHASYKLGSRKLPGMTGSGLFIVNPPWTLEKSMQAMLPEFVRLLALDNETDFTLLNHASG